MVRVTLLLFHPVTFCITQLKILNLKYMYTYISKKVIINPRNHPYIHPSQYRQHIKTMRGKIFYKDDDDDSNETDDEFDDATINNSSIAFKKFRSYILLF